MTGRGGESSTPLQVEGSVAEQDITWLFFPHKLTTRGLVAENWPNGVMLSGGDPPSLQPSFLELAFGKQTSESPDSKSSQAR